MLIHGCPINANYTSFAVICAVVSSSFAILSTATPLALVLTSDLDIDPPLRIWSDAAFDPLACRNEPHSQASRLEVEYAGLLAIGVPFPRRPSDSYHLQALPPPTTKSMQACPALSFTTPLQGHFEEGGDFGPRFQLYVCNLRRLTPDQALSCLAGRRVIWVGESLTRYQSASLAYWLAEGRYQHPFDVVAPGAYLLSHGAMLQSVCSMQKYSQTCSPGGSAMYAWKQAAKALTASTRQTIPTSTMSAIHTVSLSAPVHKFTWKCCV